MEYGNRGYITVTDQIPADGITDVADALQNLIDENPNRTLFFPDGVYLLGKPIRTPAHPEKSVDLQLSNFACLRRRRTGRAGRWCVWALRIRPIPSPCRAATTA